MVGTVKALRVGIKEEEKKIEVSRIIEIHQFHVKIQITA
jgi:hypothetical protein